MQRILTAAGAAALAALLLGAAPIRTADPLQLMHYIIGTWHCSSTQGGQPQTYTATYSYALGGRWLRSVNTSHDSTSEDFMSYADKTWRVIDVQPSGTASIVEGPDTGLAHIAMHSTYPGPGLNVTFDRQSMSKYTLTFSGTLAGKPANWQDTCTKSSPLHQRP